MVHLSTVSFCTLLARVSVCGVYCFPMRCCFLLLLSRTFSFCLMSFLCVSCEPCFCERVATTLCLLACSLAHIFVKVVIFSRSRCVHPLRTRTRTRTRLHPVRNSYATHTITYASRTSCVRVAYKLCLVVPSGLRYARSHHPATKPSHLLAYYFTSQWS